VAARRGHEADLLTAPALLALAAAVALTLMGVLWALHLRLGDASVVDPGWSAGIGAVALLYAVLGPGWLPRRAAVAAMALVWSARLTVHLVRRMRGKPEEGRYRALRAEWGAAGHDVSRRFLAFFLFQGLLDVVLSVPMLVAALNPAPAFSAWEVSGAALWLAAIAGETAADAQLARFKADPANVGRTCDAGLWRASRHPNYFFEFLVWVAWSVFALGSPWGWVSILCPALILFFLLRVTGIPATEEQAVRSRGEAYRRYQRTTSAFVPWFPRSSK
jgi:steroid 5-alpha reductase family enzyme